jgi:hypothetical protein
MHQMKFNKDNDDWGFYVDIDEYYSHNSLNTYFKKKIPDVIIPDNSYCIDIYNFGEEPDYYDCSDEIYNDCNLYDNLYNSVYDFLEYYKNKCNTKKATNMLIKVSSTTFATLALSYLLLAIL